MNKKEIVNYVTNQNKKLPNQKIGQIEIFFKDHFVNDIDVELVFKKVNQLLPDHILELVEIVYVGDFEDFKERNINAMYSDGALYISHEQEDENDLIDDIIHEFAHAVESTFSAILYEDGLIEQSFLNKRNKLKNILKYEDYNISNYDLEKTEFDNDLDKFFFWEVGYEKLNNLSKDLFLGSYSATSLREYLARGFEEFYLGNRNFLKNICPYIYKKLVVLHEEVEDW